MPAALLKEKTSKKVLDKNIVEERVFVLKRLREMLMAQRDKFRKYLDLLEKEETAIMAEDTEKIEVHIKVEHSVLKEIFAFQKVIEPLEEMYRVSFPEKEKTIPRLKNSLDVLKEKVLVRNEKNRNLLKEKITFLRQEIREIKKNHKTESPYSKISRPSIIDITT
jgi:hypothetical protein